MNKLITITLLALFILIIYNLHPPESEDITWGVNFSTKQAEQFNLDWQETYLAILNDLEAKNIKIAGHWDLLEPREGNFDFTKLDWIMDQSAKHDARVVLAIGMKTPRWPECHIPQWANGLSNEDLQEKILNMLETVISRYKNHPALASWQIENEPLVKFGPCAFRDKDFLEKEINLARELDPNHEILTSDSGELSMWFKTAKYPDRLAVTQYQRVWSGDLNMYMSLPIPQSFYAFKVWMIETFMGKEVFVGELQAEPWVKGELSEVPISETERTLTLEHLKDNIQFAKETGMSTFYLWGAEWWYHMKQNHERPEFWEEAQTILK